MSRQITVVTPENVRIEYELAGIASRAGAALIDMLLQALLIIALYALREAAFKTFGLKGSSVADAVLWVLIFLIFYGYHVYFEAAWNGQTPGKRYARMRAVREGGLPVDLQCAAVRNLVRVIDMLPGAPPYLVGGISVIVSGSNKRLGDIAAGTIVVKERAEWAQSLTRPAVDRPAARYAEAAYVKNIDLVTADEFEAIKRYLDRRAELQEHVREQVAGKIADPLMARLGIEDDGRIRRSNLLAEIYRECSEQRGMR